MTEDNLEGKLNIQEKLDVENLIFNQDNFRNIPDKSVDFILTDPPFNIARETNFHTYKDNTIHSYKFDAKAEENWDTFTHEEFIQKMFDWSAEFNRVLKKGGNFAIFCADAYISFFMDALKANGLSPRRVISWTKPNAVPVNRAYMPTSAVEYIIVGVKGGKATFNADVEIVEQQLDSKLVDAVIVAEKTASIVNSLTRQAILEMIASSEKGEIGTGVGETAKAETGVYAEAAENHVKQILDTVKQTLQSKEDIILDRVENMYKAKRVSNIYKPVYQTM